jgi:hypothetical protein
MEIKSVGMMIIPSSSWKVIKFYGSKAPTRKYHRNPIEKPIEIPLKSQ